MAAIPPDIHAAPSARAVYAACAAGATANMVGMMLRVAIPLWTIQLNMSPTMIGIIIGAAGVLPFFLSIHGGVLMDRFGTRRVNIMLAVVGTLAIALYPVLPFVIAVIVLQMITGLTTTMGWMGAQSLIVKIAPGDTALIGKFSIFARVGNLIAPILTGVLWDFTGQWGTFLVMAVCSMAGFTAFYLAPAAEVDRTATRQKTSARDLAPRFSEYVEAFSMIAVPVIAFIVVISFVRNAGSGVQSSFYLVYLDQVGISGTMIGILVGLGEGFGIFGAGIAGRIERAIKPHWTLIVFHVLAVVFICITPALGSVIVLLMLAAIIRGLSHGLAQPVMFSVLSRAVSREEQARSVGLRTTINRISTVGIPPFMGVLADQFGLEASFAITGALILGICLVLSIFARGMKEFQT